MNETPEIVRRQMDETKLQLADKLQSLELQVTERVQSTGSAVNSTVEAVQETFETVTGAVHDVVHSVTNALDVQRQINRHPWLVLGGAAVLGYLAVDFLTAPKKKTPPSPDAPLPTRPLGNDASRNSDNSDVAMPASQNADAVARQSAGESSTWNQLRDAAIGALIRVMPEIASQIVPRVVNSLIENWDSPQTRSSETDGTSQASSLRKHSSELDQRLHIASPENVRSRKSF